MVAGVRADVGVKLFGDDLDVLAAKAAEIEAVLKTHSRQRRRERRAGHRPAGAADQGRTRTQLARYGVPAQGGARRRRSDRQQAGGRGRRRPAAVSARRCGCRSDIADEPGGDRRDPGADGRRASDCRCRGWPTIEMVEGPVDDHARVGPAADHRHGQRPRPRHGQLRRRGPAADRRTRSTLPPGRYFVECGGQFEHLRAGAARGC